MRRLVLGRGHLLPAGLPAQVSVRVPLRARGRVIGIDPGTLRVGYAVLEAAADGRAVALDFGVIRPAPKDPIEARLRHIHDALAGLLARWRPSGAAMESAFFGASVPAALRIGEGRGAALVAAAAAGVAVSSYPPATVKKSVAMHGQATKGAVRDAVSGILALKGADIPLDASDALAIALCHLLRTR